MIYRIVEIDPFNGDKFYGPYGDLEAGRETLWLKAVSCICEEIHISKKKEFSEAIEQAKVEIHTYGSYRNYVLMAIT